MISLIIERLSRARGIDLDEGLSAGQRAISLAFRRMLDEHLYWTAVHSRWFEEPGWSLVRKGFFSRIPWPVRPVVERQVRRKIASALHAQGTGRHSQDDIWRLGVEDIRALGDLLGTDTGPSAASGRHCSISGRTPTSPRSSSPLIDLPLKQAALGLANLTAHCDRLQARLYPSNR